MNYFIRKPQNTRIDMTSTPADTQSTSHMSNEDSYLSLTTKSLSNNVDTAPIMSGLSSKFTSLPNSSVGIPSYSPDTRTASPIVTFPSLPMSSGDHLFNASGPYPSAPLQNNTFDTDVAEHKANCPRQLDFGLNGENMRHASDRVNVMTRSRSTHQPVVGTILQPEHDGLSCTPYREGLIVLGGLSMKHIWRFSFRTMLWCCITTQGQFAPPGRLNHSVALWEDCLYVSGGSCYEKEDLLCVYKLDLGSLRWTKLPCRLPGREHQRNGSNTSDSEYEDSDAERGYTLNEDTGFEPCLYNVPLSRTHHTSIVVHGNLYVHGGKPIYDNMASFDIRQLHSCCFFEVLELNLSSFEWKALGHTVKYEDRETGAERTEYCPPPPLWGHSIICMGGTALILFGGFEIDLASKVTDGQTFSSHADYTTKLVNGGIGEDDQLPSAEMTALVHVFGFKTGKWATFAPRIMEPSPQPRALHGVHLLNDSEMIVLGGVCMEAQESVGGSYIPDQVTPCADGWVWNIDTGTWRKLDPFPLPDPSTNIPNKVTSAKLFSAIYNMQLVLGNDISMWYVLDVSNPVEIWQTDRTGDCERGVESEIFYCAVASGDEWQKVEAIAPSSLHSPLFQEGLQELGNVLHPRKRHMLYNRVYEMISAERRGKKGPELEGRYNAGGRLVQSNQRIGEHHVAQRPSDGYAFDQRQSGSKNYGISRNVIREEVYVNPVIRSFIERN